MRCLLSTEVKMIGNVVERREFLFQELRPLLHRVVVFLYEVPLVDYDHATLAVADDQVVDVRGPAIRVPAGRRASGCRRRNSRWRGSSASPSRIRGPPSPCPSCACLPCPRGRNPCRTCCSGCGSSRGWCRRSRSRCCVPRPATRWSSTTCRRWDGRRW